MSVHKYASRFQMVCYLNEGYQILPWGEGKYGLYLRSKFFVNSFKTRLAASGTKEELETWLKEFEK